METNRCKRYIVLHNLDFQAVEKSRFERKKRPVRQPNNTQR